MPAATVDGIGKESGLSDAEAIELAAIYVDSQLSSLGTAFFGLIALTLPSLLLSCGIPNEAPEPRPKRTRAAASAK